MLHRLALVFARLAPLPAPGMADGGDVDQSANRCASCHDGGPLASTEDAVHDSLVAFPGKKKTGPRAGPRRVKIA